MSNRGQGKSPPFTYMIPDAVFALPATKYEVLLKHDNDRVSLCRKDKSGTQSTDIVNGTQRRTYTTGNLLNRQTLKWLAWMNWNGFNILWRPVGPHIVIDLDDVSDDLWHAMIMDGLKMSLLTQTSASNYQAWITLGRGRSPVDEELAACAQRLLTYRYGGDAHAVGATRFGRLPPHSW